MATFLGLWLLLVSSAITSMAAAETRLRGESDTSTLFSTVLLVVLFGLAAVARWLADVVRATASRHVRLGIPILCGAAAAAALVLWLMPGGLGEERRLPTEVVDAGDRVYVTPYPTQALLRRVAAPGTAIQIVSLLDPADAEDLAWIQREKLLAARAGAVVHAMPLVRDPYDPVRALDVARAARALPRPVVVHAYLPPRSGRAPATEAFLQAWRTGALAIPPGLFRDPMQRGQARVVSPTVAVGPRPTVPEFGRLRRQGIQRFLFVGQAADPDARYDRRIAEEDVLDWSVFTGPAAHVLTRLAQEPGPWYLYGPGAASAAAVAGACLGPAVPAPGPARLLPAALGLMPATAFLRVIPPYATQVLALAPVFLLVAVLTACFVVWLRTAHRRPPAFTRKAFECAVFTQAALVQHLGGVSSVVIFALGTTAVVLYASWRGPAFPLYEALDRNAEGSHRRWRVLSPLALAAVGGLLASWLFAPFAPAAYLAGGWADSASMLFLRRRFERSLSPAGVLAVVVGGALAAAAGLALLGIPLGAALLAGAGCGVTVALVRAATPLDLRKLTLPLTAAATAFWLVR